MTEGSEVRAAGARYRVLPCRHQIPFAWFEKKVENIEETSRPGTWDMLARSASETLYLKFDSLFDKPGHHSVAPFQNVYSGQVCLEVVLTLLDHVDS